MQLMVNTKHSHKGFTLLEVILTMLILVLVMGVASEVMMKQGEAYSYVNNRKSALQDARYGLHLIKVELEDMDAPDFQSISATSLSYYDDTGALRSYYAAPTSGALGLFAGSQLLIGQLQSFWIDYFDSTGTPILPSLATMGSVRRMTFNIQTKPKNGEGSITMNMQIIPRDFLGYKNFK